MRLIAMLLAGHLSVASADAARPAAQSATLDYQNRLATIAVRAVVPALGARMDQFLPALPMKVHCRINARGQVESVTVLSRRPNRFVENTTGRVLRTTKFPPIPKEVMAELGKNWLEVTFDFG